MFIEWCLNTSQINVSVISTVIEKIGHPDRKVCDVSIRPFVNTNKARQLG